jgi:protein-disulfide isomerase-like protein with CxxC motif
MTPRVTVSHFTDPCCPWAYSASPAHAAMRWRFGDQLDERLLLIGLSETPERYDRAGYTPVRSAIGYAGYRRYGMVFGGQPRERNVGTGRACRVVVAARLQAPALALPVLRALQIAHFTTPVLLDTDDGLHAALERVRDRVDPDALIAAAGESAVEDAYQADRAAARTAAGSPTEAQGRSANTDGAVRYTAPSWRFEDAEGRRLEAGGFQPLEAYDVCLANLDPTLERRPRAQDPVEVVAAMPYPPTTREVAACMAPHLTAPDDDATEALLISAAGEGRVRREPVGSGALWHLTS